jgi:HK97 gp10 family phage protein
MKVKFKITKGFKDVAKEINAESLELTFRVVNEAGKKAKIKARANAPVDTGYHRSNIIRRTVRRRKGAKLSLEAKAPYAPYLEFGTGVYVSVPHGYEELAAAFKGASPPNNPMPARPHIIPAMHEASAEIEEVLRKRLPEL